MCEKRVCVCVCVCVFVPSLCENVGYIALCVCVVLVVRSEEHTSELQSHLNLVCRLLREKNNQIYADTCVCVLRLSEVLIVSQRGVCARALVHLHARTRVSPLLSDDVSLLFFFLRHTAQTDTHTLSLHDVIPN